MTWMVALLLVVLSAPARPQQLIIDGDGCGVLASVVYKEVTRARLGNSTETYRDVLYPGRDQASLCNQTVRSVTSAFTSALRQVNIYVTWGIRNGFGRDHCVSHSLSRCYPARDPAMPALNASDRSFVVRTWQAVYDSVSGSMSPTPGSNVSRFRADELARSIRLSINAGVAASATLGEQPLPRKD